MRLSDGANILDERLGTAIMWNGKRSEEALLGVFSKAPYLLVGTEEEPCPYSAKVPEREAYKGKQFSVAATKTSKMPKDFFGGTFKPLFEGETFQDRLPYRELQPDKPHLGFQTSDYNKRDEFSLTIRMEQHRQQLKHEAKVEKLAHQKGQQKEQASGRTGSQQQADPPRQAPLLFDLVYNGEADLCIKAKRDTRNPTALTCQRNLGPYKTTAALNHSRPPGQAKRPEYGHCSAHFD